MSNLISKIKSFINIFIKRFKRLYTFLTQSAVFILPLFLLLPSCNDKLIKHSGKTMGTTYQVQYIETDNSFKAALITDYLKQFNQIFSSWQQTSELSRINQAPIKQWLPISASLSILLQAAKKIYAQSNGYFDISMGKALNLWGFYSSDSQASLKLSTKLSTKPSTQQILNAKTQSGMVHLLLKDKHLKKERAIWLDLSAFAKGYAIDELAKLMIKAGIKNFIIEIGGEVLARGKKNKRKWQLGIKHSDAKISLSNQSIATSGNYNNFVRFHQQNYGHIFNPKTAIPIKSAFFSVSVIHKSTMLADAYATAIMAMPLKIAKKFIEKQQLSVILVYDNALRTIEKINF